MKKIVCFTCFAMSYFLPVNAQSEGLTGSPYSLYGLGVTNPLSVGKYNALGRSGIALSGSSEINNLNPASYAAIHDKSFLFDVGFQSEYNRFSNRQGDEGKWSFNFSNLAFAFSLSERSGLGLTLIPYSNVGYTLLGLTSNIEGSDEEFKSTITGSGGLNDIRLNYGYALTDKIRLGASASYLFGNIRQNEFFYISSSYFEMNETTFYNGFRLGGGVQYDITRNLSVGATAQFPVSLKGSMDRTVYKTLDGVTVTVEDKEGEKVPDFKLPAEIGFGVYFSPFRGLSVNADYKKNFWTSTEQRDNIGKYEDQDIFGVGVEYLRDARGLEYTHRIRYRAGFSSDNGYLSINNRKVGGYALTAGLGLPVSPNTNSLLNISYSYGQKGQISNILIKENYHFITLNISLEDLWFIKRKYD